MEWINLAQDRDTWRGLVRTVINLRVPYIARISSITRETLASHERLYSMESVITIPIILGVN